MSGLRLLRIVVFAPLAAAVLAAAAPRLWLLVGVVRGPFSSVEQLPSPVAWTGAGLLAIAALASLVRETSGGPRPPRALLLALLPLLLLCAHAGAPPRDLDRGPALLARAAAFLRAGWPVSGAELPGSTPLRDRLGRRLPLRLRVVREASGPVLAALPGDPPGTVYLAVAEGGAPAWLTGLTVARSGEPALIREGRTPLVLQIREVP